MNAYLAALMDKPSVRPGWCVVCGLHPATGHHVIPRSQGGIDGPVLDLCGHGTVLCHGDAEDKRLHFRWRDGWEYRRTPTPTKYEYVLEMSGWQPLPGIEEGR